MVSANGNGKFSTPRRSWPGKIRSAVAWVMIFGIAQTLLVPLPSHAEMAGYDPHVDAAVGIGLFAGLVAILIVVGLLSRKGEEAPATQEQKPGDSMEPPENTSPSPRPAGTVAVISWQ